VRHHHVAVGAGLLVEAAALAQAQRLGHVDLHVVDEVAVPDRLEQAVGEAERQDVLRRLLAQEVVDAEDLLFANTSCSALLSATALARSVPKGFSITMRERSTRSASPSICTAGSAALGGTLR
jgi:hypothetical protein